MYLYSWELPGHTLALLGLVWYIIVVIVIFIGTYQLFTHYSRPTPAPISSRLPLVQVPHVTIIRPVAGLEALWKECLTSAFQQNYPASKLTIYFCVESREEPTYSSLKELLAEHPSFDARIFVESEDPNLHGPKGSLTHLGPNPKIRNMSAAYREAKGELMWIVDANVWVSASACGLMVDKLCGLGGQRKHKFVHQLPLVVDVSAEVPAESSLSLFGNTGAALDELFLATAHAKFYTAINTVAIAPCSVGKSTMFRRHHLAALTPTRRAGRTPGIDFFSDNICEDHLIGDLLWKRRVPVAVQQAAAREGLPPAPVESGASPARKRLLRNTDAGPAAAWSNHAALIAPPCVQPLAHVSLGAYVARRARWLRVRKFTVPAATAVEPGTESVLASMCLASGVTGVPAVRDALGVGSSWSAWTAVFVVGVLAWAALDLAVWMLLQGWTGEGGGASGDAASTSTSRGSARLTTSQSDWPDAAARQHAAASGRVLAGRAGPRKSALRWWARHWLGRELLAFPVWAYAVLGGTTVRWRGRRFKVAMDARVRALDEDEGVHKKREKEKEKKRK